MWGIPLLLSFVEMSIMPPSPPSIHSLSPSIHFTTSFHSSTHDVPFIPTSFHASPTYLHSSTHVDSLISTSFHSFPASFHSFRPPPFIHPIQQFPFTHASPSIQPLPHSIHSHTSLYSLPRLLSIHPPTSFHPSHHLLPSPRPSTLVSLHSSPPPSMHLPTSFNSFPVSLRSTPTSFQFFPSPTSFYSYPPFPPLVLLPPHPSFHLSTFRLSLTNSSHISRQFPPFIFFPLPSFSLLLLPLLSAPAPSPIPTCRYRVPQVPHPISLPISCFPSSFLSLPLLTHLLHLLFNLPAPLSPTSAPHLPVLFLHPSPASRCLLAAGSSLKWQQNKQGYSIRWLTALHLTPLMNSTFPPDLPPPPHNGSSTFQGTLTQDL
jgi:hypothetical protein